MTNPSIRERLVLDHFYIPVTSEELASLSKMTSRLRDSVHSRVVSGDDHWEGIYITSRIGDYFEIVRYPRASNLGLAFSPAKPQYTDARKIAEELPNLDWKRGARVTKSNQPWFDWLSLSDDSDPVIPAVKAWVMHYHSSHQEQTRMPSGPRVIDRFKKIELTVGRDLIPALRVLIPWLPGSQTWGENKASLLLPLRDGHHFEVRISIIDGKIPLSFRALEMEITRGEDVEPGEFGRYSLTKTDAHTIIFRKNGADD
jgi:hypothetical protein